MENRLKTLFLNQIAEGLTIDNMLDIYILTKSANRVYCFMSPTTAESRVAQSLGAYLTGPCH